MNETLTDIGRRINECFVYVKENISLEELAEFQEYISEQEALMPLLQPTAWRNGGSKGLQLAGQRVKLLKNLLEAEEKLLEGAK